MAASGAPKYTGRKVLVGLLVAAAAGATAAYWRLNGDGPPARR